MEKFKFTKKRTILLIVCVLVLILAKCSVLLVRRYQTTATAENDLAKLRDVYTDTPEDEPPSSQTSFSASTSNTQSEEPAPDSSSDNSIPLREIDFAALQEEVNSDIYAWITIPDTEIDYPLVQHPTDNTYYLDHNLDGSAGYPGCIYTENYNTTTWEDPNTVLYGHNMKDGSMFAGLHEYEDKTFFEAHPHIYVYSPDSFNVYQVFAAYEYSDTHLFAACDWDNPDSVAEYLAHISDYPGISDNNIAVDTDNKLLTLSTCISGKESKRFLVQAVLIEQEE